MHHIPRMDTIMTWGLLDHLNEQMKGLSTRSTAILDKASATNRELTPAEAGEFDSLTNEMRAIGARRDEILAEMRRNDQIAEAMQRHGLIGAGNKPGGGKQSAAWLPTRRQYVEMEAEQRATGYSNSGALLLTQQYSAWFDRLRNASVVLQAAHDRGGRIVPIDGRAVSVPVVTSSVTVANVDENTSITSSDPATAGVVLTPVAFKALTQVGNESLSDSQPELAGLVADDLIRSCATAIDAAMLVGPGGTSPTKVLGLRNKAGITDTGNTLIGANGAVPVLDNFADMLALLEGLNGNADTSAFFVTPGVWGVLRKIKDGQGRYQASPDPTLDARLSLFGVPVYKTGNLPQTETKGTATSVCSSIILADMSRIVIGVGQDVRVQQSDDFYFDKDATALRVTARFDIQALNENAIVVTKGAKLS